MSEEDSKREELEEMAKMLKENRQEALAKDAQKKAGREGWIVQEYMTRCENKNFALKDVNVVSLEII